MRVLLIAYDNDSYIHHFPLNLAYVAAGFIGSGDDVVVYNQDVYHYPESHLTEFLNTNHFDAVGLGMCAGYYQYQKLLRICNAIHESRFSGKLCLGGHLVAPEPEYFKKLTGADWICTGDFCDVINTSPALHLFPIDYYSLIRLPHAENKDRCFPVLSGHGCPFRCSFCYRLAKGYQERPIPDITDEVAWLKKEHHITYIDFADELLMTSSERIHRICDMMETAGMKWMCNGRLNYASQKVLERMKETGCMFINYGIESVNDEVLRNMNKALTSEQVYEGIWATLDAGISPGLNLIWGNIGDSVRTLWESVEFIRTFTDFAQLRTIRPVTPYPGSPLYYHAIEQGLLEGVEDFYKKHINSDLASVQFTGLSDYQFHHELRQANGILLDDYNANLLRLNRGRLDKLYLRRDATFRGFRQT